MALNTNIPMMGQGIDTANPLAALSKGMAEKRMSDASLAASKIDVATKTNLYTMQTMSAGAAGGQQSYEAAKQHLKSMGIDTNGWAQDYKTGAEQSAALQKALIPPAVMMNAGIQQQKADAATAATNGVMAPAGPGSNLQTGSNYPPQVSPQQVAAGQQPVNPPQQNVSLAQSPDAGQPDEAAAIQHLKDHYDTASPENKKQVQDISNGAVQLAKLQNDPQAVQGFLNDPKNIHSKENLELRDLWKQQDKTAFWQKNQEHINLGILTGVISQDQAQSPGLQQGLAETQGFTPSQGPANENPSAKERRIANELSVYNANPKNIAAKKEAEAQGTAAGVLPEKAATAKALTDRVSAGLDAMLKINDKVPSAGMFNADTKAMVSKKLGNSFLGDNQAGANAYNLMNEINKQQVIVGLQDLLAAAPAGSRMSQALIGLVNKASAVDMENSSATSREDQINAIKAELKNVDISAANVNASMNGGTQQPYVPIPTGSVSSPSGKVTNWGIKDGKLTPE